MAKITISDITSGFNLSKINAAIQALEDELNNKVLYRNNPAGEPNSMQNDLDMNSNDILNADNIDCQSITVDGVGVDFTLTYTPLSAMNTYEFTAGAAQTTYTGTDDNGKTLSYTPNLTIVSVNGYTLPTSDYTAINSADIILDAAPAEGSVVTIVSIERIALTDWESDVLTGIGNSAYVSESVPTVLPVATGVDALAAGEGAIAATANSISFGRKAEIPITGNENSVAAGYNCYVNTSVHPGTGVGSWISLSGEVADGFGTGAVAADYSAGFGAWSHAEDYSTALGNSSRALNKSVAAGFGSDTWNYQFAIAYGNYSSVDADKASCLGAYAGANAIGSIVLGYGGDAQRANEINTRIIPDTTIGNNYFRGSAGWAGDTTSTDPTEIFAAGTLNERFAITSFEAILTFDIIVTAKDDVTNNAAAFQFRGSIKKVGGTTTSLIGAVVKDILGKDVVGFDCDVIADDVNDALTIVVTAPTANNTRWAAQGQFVEIRY